MKLTTYHSGPFRGSKSPVRESKGALSLQLLPTSLQDATPVSIESMRTVFTTGSLPDDQLLFGVPGDLYREQVHSSPLPVLPSSMLGEDTNPGQEAGKWFFVIYVVVSLAAGIKEFAGRFQQWKENRDEK